VSRQREVVLAGYRGDVAAIRAAWNDPDPAVRAVVVVALVRSGDLRADDVEAALRDPAATVRRHAADLLAQHRAPAPASTVLLAALHDPDARVVEAVAHAVGELEVVDRDPVAALIAVATDHEDALCRESAVAALGSLGDPAGLDAVLGGCEDRANVRRRAVLALAAFEGDAVEAMLRRMAEDRDLQVRQAAEDLLAIGDPDGDQPA